MNPMTVVLFFLRKNFFLNLYSRSVLVEKRRWMLTLNIYIQDVFISHNNLH